MALDRALSSAQPPGWGVEAVWHTDLLLDDAPELQWWLSEAPADAKASVSNIRCAQLRVDTTPRSADDCPFPAAEARIADAAVALVTSGVLGAATIVAFSSPAPASRMRTHKGVFWDRPALRAGPRFELEAPEPSGETTLIGFAPLTEANMEVGVAPGSWGVILFHPPPVDDRLWRRIAPDIVGPTAQPGGMVGLISRVVRGPVALLTRTVAPEQAVSACLYYDRSNEGAVHWAVEQSLGGARPVV